MVRILLEIMINSLNSLFCRSSFIRRDFRVWLANKSILVPPLWLFRGQFNYGGLKEEGIGI